MARLVVPAEVQAVFHQVRTCEFTTLANHTTPIARPTVALYEPANGRFVITTSIGLPHKADNLRHTPRVAMLDSDATGSGLAAPPAVLADGLVPDAAAALRHSPPDPLVAPRRPLASAGGAGGRPCGLRSSGACRALPARC